MKHASQYLVGVAIGVTAAYLYNLAKHKGLLPGVPSHAA